MADQSLAQSRNVESALCSLLDAGWAPTSASQASGVAAALAGPPPWAVGTAPCVSACPRAPDTLPSRALAPWAGLSRADWGPQPPLPHLHFSSQPSAPLAAGVASALLPTSAPARTESKEPPAQVTAGGPQLMGRILSALRLCARLGACVLLRISSSSNPFRYAFSSPVYR